MNDLIWDYDIVFEEAAPEVPGQDLEAFSLRCPKKLWFDREMAVDFWVFKEFFEKHKLMQYNT